MSTEAKPRLKITYATLRNDNEELHAQYEAGLAKARSMLGGYLPQLRRRRRARRRRHVREADPDRRLGHGHVREGHPEGRPGRDRGRPRGLPGLGPPAVAGAGRDPAPGRRRHQRAPDGVQRAALDRGRQEPARGARRRRGDRRPHPLVVRHDGAQPRLRRRRWATSATRPSTPGRSSSRTACGASSARSTSRSRCRGGPAGGALVAGNTVVYKPSSDAPLSGACLLQAMRDAGVPDGVFNMVMGPGETVGDELQTNPGVDGVIFTGSFEVGFGLYKNFARSYPEAGHRRDGRQEPGDRVAPRRPRRGGRGDHALGVRLLRPEVLGEQPGLRRAPGPRRARPAAGREDRGDHDRRPDRPRATGSGRSSTRRAVARYEQAVAEARSAGRLAIGGERVTEHGLDSGFFVAPTVALDLPKDHRLFRDELFVPFTAVAAVDSIDEALRLSNDTNLGLTAGFYSEDKAEVDSVPRRDRGGRRLRQPAGRRDDRRLAGHPAVRRLEGEHRDGQGRRRLLLRPAVHARAEPDDRRLTAGPPAAAPDDAAASRPDVEPALPHPVTRRRRGASRS